MKRRRAWISLALLVGSVVLYGGIGLARPIISRLGCICLRPNQVFTPLPESSLNEAIPPPARKACCRK